MADLGGLGGTPGVKTAPGEFQRRATGGWYGAGVDAGKGGSRGKSGGGPWAKDTGKKRVTKLVKGGGK